MWWKETTEHVQQMPSSNLQTCALWDSPYLDELTQHPPLCLQRCSHAARFLWAGSGRDGLVSDPVLSWTQSPESSLQSCPSPWGWDFLSCFLSPAAVSFHQHPEEDSVGYPPPKGKLPFCRGDTGEAFRQILSPFPQQLPVSPPLLPIKVDVLWTSPILPMSDWRDSWRKKFAGG